MTLEELKNNNVDIRVIGKHLDCISIFIGSILVYRVEGEYSHLYYDKIPEGIWNKIANRKIVAIYSDWEDFVIELEV